MQRAFHPGDMRFFRREIGGAHRSRRIEDEHQIFRTLGAFVIGNSSGQLRQKYCHERDSKDAPMPRDDCNHDL